MSFLMVWAVPVRSWGFPHPQHQIPTCRPRGVPRDPSTPLPMAPGSSRHPQPCCGREGRGGQLLAAGFLLQQGTRSWEGFRSKASCSSSMPPGAGSPGVFCSRARSSEARRSFRIQQRPDRSTTLSTIPSLPKSSLLPGEGLTLLCEAPSSVQMGNLVFETGTGFHWTFITHILLRLSGRRENAYAYYPTPKIHSTTRIKRLLLKLFFVTKKEVIW